MIKKLISYFLQGLLFTVPIAATVWVIYKLFFYIDTIIPFDVPGIGILVIIGIITFFGYLGTLYVANPLFSLIEKLLERAPLTKIIYSSVKDLISAFVGEKKRFTQPVLVTVNSQPTIQRIGFITQDSLTHLGLDKEKLAVYLPFSYGFNGQLVIVDAVNVSKLNASGTEVMKFIISGGVTEI